MLTLRKRGRVWHVRGSIRVGQETRIVEEHSTGCDRREDAEAYRSRIEHETRQELLHGSGGRAHAMTIADAGLRYVNRPGGVMRYDLWRLDQINEVVGDHSKPGPFLGAVRRPQASDCRPVPVRPACRLELCC